MGVIRKVTMLILPAVGLAISAGSLIMMNNFMKTLRPVLVMGSRAGSGGAIIQSIIVALVLTLLFVSGILLFVISARKILRSVNK
jgi:hypothetical protein